SVSGRASGTALARSVRPRLTASAPGLRATTDDTEVHPAYGAVVFGSQLLPAPFTETRILIVSGRARGADAIRLRRVAGARLARSETLFEIFLNPIAIIGSRVELLDDARSPGSQARRHLVEVRVGQFPHRVVELELLDRPERQQLFSLERGARALSDAAG